MSLPGLIGMVHLAPLPGSPRFGGSIQQVIERAIRESMELADAGFPALMVENFGDAPFHAETVEPVTVAAMTRIVTEVQKTVDVPIGVNVLRNDATAAASIAAVTGASMIRVNVLSGTMFTDQGPIVGRAGEVARLVGRLSPGLEILADVFVKHAVPPAGLTVEQAAIDTWERGGATALVVSGAGTGQPIELGQAVAVRKAVPDAPLVIGSGATPATLDRLREVSDGVIVGTALKDPQGELDRRRVLEFAEAARRAGYLESGSRAAG